MCVVCRRLVGAFYKNGEDMLLADIPSRPYFICNCTVKLKPQRSKIELNTPQPFFLSKDFCGSVDTGFRATRFALCVVCALRVSCVCACMCACERRLGLLCSS